MDGKMKRLPNATVEEPGVWINKALDTIATTPRFQVRRLRRGEGQRAGGRASCRHGAVCAASRGAQALGQRRPLETVATGPRFPARPPSPSPSPLASASLPGAALAGAGLCVPGHALWLHRSVRQAAVRHDAQQVQAGVVAAAGSARSDCCSLCWTTLLGTSPTQMGGGMERKACRAAPLAALCWLRRCCASPPAPPCLPLPMRPCLCGCAPDSCVPRPAPCPATASCWSQPTASSATKTGPRWSDGRQRCCHTMRVGAAAPPRAALRGAGEARSRCRRHAARAGRLQAGVPCCTAAADGLASCCVVVLQRAALPAAPPSLLRTSRLHPTARRTRAPAALVRLCAVCAPRTPRTPPPAARSRRHRPGPPHCRLSARHLPVHARRLHQLHQAVQRRAPAVLHRPGVRGAGRGRAGAPAGLRQAACGRPTACAPALQQHK